MQSTYFYLFQIHFTDNILFLGFDMTYFPQEPSNQLFCMLSLHKIKGEIQIPFQNRLAAFSHALCRLCPSSSLPLRPTLWMRNASYAVGLVKSHCLWLWQVTTTRSQKTWCWGAANSSYTCREELTSLWECSHFFCSTKYWFTCRCFVAFSTVK